MITVEELARQVLKLLALQQEYFHTRSTTKLNECRDAERRMEKVCRDIINPPQPGLFDQAK